MNGCTMGQAADPGVDQSGILVRMDYNVNYCVISNYMF